MKKPKIQDFLFIVFIFTFLFAGGNKMVLDVGSKAPDFTVLSSNGDTVRLADFAGKNNVVLIFYPGDETPGCTKQLCAVRDDFASFEAKGIKVFGVNPAGTDSHNKFIKNHSFQFSLLIDEGQKVAKLYGCDNQPSVKRTVYAIDKKGMIVFAKSGMPDDSEILKSISDNESSK
jgi:thioredoxin-dependent peroxiredoxin